MKQNIDYNNKINNTKRDSNLTHNEKRGTWCIVKCQHFDLKEKRTMSWSRFSKGTIKNWVCNCLSLFNQFSVSPHCITSNLKKRNMVFFSIQYLYMSLIELIQYFRICKNMIISFFMIKNVRSEYLIMKEGIIIFVPSLL